MTMASFLILTCWCFGLINFVCTAIKLNQLKVNKTVTMEKVEIWLQMNTGTFHYRSTKNVEISPYVSDLNQVFLTSYAEKFMSNHPRQVSNLVQNWIFIGKSGLTNIPCTLLATFDNFKPWSKNSTAKIFYVKLPKVSWMLSS